MRGRINLMDRSCHGEEEEGQECPGKEGQEEREEGCQEGGKEARQKGCQESSEEGC